MSPMTFIVSLTVFVRIVEEAMNIVPLEVVDYIRVIIQALYYIVLLIVFILQYKYKKCKHLKDEPKKNQRK